MPAGFEYRSLLIKRSLGFASNLSTIKKVHSSNNTATMVPMGWICYRTKALKSLFLNLNLAKCGVRAISTELTTALRPFYFAVHPDLFGQHPEQRRMNEDSLKLLISHIESLYEGKFHVLNETKSLQFYIRDTNSTSRDSFKLIRITLDRRIREPKVLIQNLLELCSLSTEYIRSVKSMASFQAPVDTSSHSPSSASSSFKAGGDYNYGPEFSGFEYNFYQAKHDSKNHLDEWIKTNAELARKRADELIDLKMEVAKLQETVVSRLGLLEARYDCGWNYEHFRGCLKTLERMANMHEKQMSVLRGRIVVFASFTGVSIEGHIMLFTGDVLNNWIDFIKNIPQQDEFLKKIPFHENTLSQVLRQIKIGRRKFMPKQQAKEYAGHLTKVTTTLGDYLTVNKFPETWPSSLADYEIVIESEAGPLMVNPTGQLIAPATCPGFMLVDFISTNMALAKERTEKYQNQKHIEKELVDRCIKQLHLKTLTKDDSVTPDKIIMTINKLLKLNIKEFANLDLHITNYYSVLMDGVVCIPWDFMDR